jgi:RimJ/RimL family protein N-acetyltransferase
MDQERSPSTYRLITVAWGRRWRTPGLVQISSITSGVGLQPGGHKVASQGQQGERWVEWPPGRTSPVAMPVSENDPMEPITLEGRFVRLEPLDITHVDALLAAAGEDRSTYGFTAVPWDRATMTAYVEKALAHHQAGDHLPFATVGTALGRVVGTTRFYDIDTWDWLRQFPGSEALQRHDRPDVASIGYTWLDAAAQRTPVNTEAKLVMLDHAFGVWEVRAVRIQTDARNARSRAAIERIGFSLDGVIRADMPGSDGTIRDSAVYSMLPGEWPAHRARLLERLDR